MPALVQVMEDSSPNVQVIHIRTRIYGSVSEYPGSDLFLQGHGASCVINFAEGAKKEHMLLYSEVLYTDPYGSVYGTVL